MCTIIVASQVYADCPLFIASNRDEFFDRPASEFRRWPGEPYEFLAPVDLRAGGTWIGVNSQGVCAAITNRYGEKPNPERRTRGALVPRALKHQSALEAIRSFADLEPQAYNPFHLLVADAGSAGVIWSDGQQLHRVVLPAGFSLITEQSFGAKTTGRESALEASLAGLPSREELTSLMAQKITPEAGGALIEIPQLNYGTRSSTLIAYRTQERPRIRHANAAPDRARYQDVRWAETPIKQRA